MANIAPYSFFQEFDNNGEPLAGGLLYTYEAGTSTPKATFTDASGAVQNTNPIVLDASGRADVWLEDGAYKFVLNTSADVLVKEVDDIVGGQTGGFGSTVLEVSTNTNITETNANNHIVTTSGVTLSLDAAATLGAGFVFSVQNTSASDTTIDPNLTEQINNASTLVLTQNESAIVFCDGTQFFAIVAGIEDLTLIFDALSSADGFVGDDFLMWGDISDSNIAKKTTMTSFRNQLFLITGTENTIDPANDEVWFRDNSSGVVRKTSISNLLSNVDTDSITLGTPQTTTSGTTVDFTSIPSGTKKITISLVGVSLSGTDDILVRIGDSGGLETTGYIGTGTLATGSVSTTASTTGLRIKMGTASIDANGSLILTLVDSTNHIWAANGTFSHGNQTSTAFCGGSKTLSEELDRISLVTTGSDTFDAGTVNIAYES